MPSNIHIPVLLNEVIHYLDPKPNENFIDATIGGGGHAAAILERIAPSGKALGIEVDSELYDKLTALKNDRLILVNDSYVNLKKIVAQNYFGPVHGILADLGLSSWHLEQSGRGFSFLKDEPLDMRYNAYQETENQKSKTKNITAVEIINLWSEEQLTDIFFKYGEERFSRQIAREIVAARKAKPIVLTSHLVEVINAGTPGWYHQRKIHPATKVFQALRIIVNDELENLKTFLPQAIEALENSGRLAVISFHSLEDRYVKNFFRDTQKEGRIKILTKKPVKPSLSEISINKKSRSARLRAVIKI